MLTRNGRPLPQAFLHRTRQKFDGGLLWRRVRQESTAPPCQHQASLCCLISLSRRDSCAMEQSWTHRQECFNVAPGNDYTVSIRMPTSLHEMTPMDPADATKPLSTLRAPRDHVFGDLRACRSPLITRQSGSYTRRVSISPLAPFSHPSLYNHVPTRTIALHHLAYSQN